MLNKFFALMFLFIWLCPNAISGVEDCEKLLSPPLRGYLASQKRLGLYVEFVVQKPTDFNQNPHYDFRYDTPIRAIQLDGKRYYSVYVQLYGVEGQALDHFLESPGLVRVRVPRTHLKGIGKVAIKSIKQSLFANEKLTDAHRIDGDFEFAVQTVLMFFKKSGFENDGEITNMRELGSRVLEFFAWTKRHLSDDQPASASMSGVLTKKAYLQRLAADPVFLKGEVNRMLEENNVFNGEKPATNSSLITPQQQEAYAKEFLDFCSRQSANPNQTMFEIFYKARLTSLSEKEIRWIIGCLRFEHGVADLSIPAP